MELGARAAAFALRVIGLTPAPARSCRLSHFLHGQPVGQYAHVFPGRRRRGIAVEAEDVFSDADPAGPRPEAIEAALARVG